MDATIGQRRPREGQCSGPGELAASAAWMRDVRPRIEPRLRASQRRQEEQEDIASREGSSREINQTTHRRPAWHNSLEEPTRLDMAGAQQVQQPKPPWGRVWRRLRRVPAPRQHRHLAWRLLHGALPCGAWLAYTAARSGNRPCSPLCHHEECTSAGRPDTLSHAFFECPASAAVFAWLSQMWSAITGGQGPAITVSAVLVGGTSAWDPGGAGLGTLWEILRLAYLHYVWAARCHARREGTNMVPARIAAQIVCFLRRRMREDATRVLSTPAVYAGVVESWLPSHSQHKLSIQDFEARWCHRGVLCSWADAEQPIIRLSVSHPIQLP